MPAGGGADSDPSATPETSPPFRTIAIVGLGLIGGSVALAARRRWQDVSIVGVDRTEILAGLHTEGVFAEVGDSLDITRGADLVVLAAPVREIIATLGRLFGLIEPSAVVTDVGSTKRAIVAAAGRDGPSLRFVGGHPLAGSVGSGFAVSTADLFTDRTWLLVPTGRGGSESVDRVSELVAGLGARPRLIDAETHDRVMAAVSHLPQVAVSALMRAVGDLAGPDGLELAGTGLLDTTRLAASPTGLWADVCATNADQLGVALDRLIETLVAIRSSLEDRQALDDVFAPAREWRRRLEQVMVQRPMPAGVRSGAC